MLSRSAHNCLTLILSILNLQSELHHYAGRIHRCCIPTRSPPLRSSSVACAEVMLNPLTLISVMLIALDRLNNGRTHWETQ